MNMCRLTLIMATIVVSILNGYTASAEPKPDAVTSEISRLLSVLDFEDDTGHAEHLHTKDLDQLRTIAYAFRHQFRNVIEELILNAFTYLKSSFHDLKVKLLKRLSKYTVSDLFHVIFDGVSEFVIDSPAEVALDVQEHVRPSYDFTQYPYVPHPYGI